MQFSNSFLKLLLTFFISLIFSRLELSLACSFQDLNGVCHVLCGTQTGSAMFFAGLERGWITLMGLKLELTCSMLNSNGVWLTFCGTRTGSDFLSARLKLGLTWSLQDSNRVLLALCGNQTRDGSLHAVRPNNAFCCEPHWFIFRFMFVWTLLQHLNKNFVWSMFHL